MSLMIDMSRPVSGVMRVNMPAFRRAFPKESVTTDTVKLWELIILNQGVFFSFDLRAYMEYLGDSVFWTISES